MRQRRFFLPLAGLFLLLLAGCAQRTANINGKLVLPQGMKLSQQDSVSIVFTPEDANNKTKAAIFSQPGDDTFAVKDLGPGKYKVSVSITAYMGDPDAAKRNTIFEQLNTKFGPGTPVLKYEVTNEPQQNITINVSDAGTITATKGP
jgi:hypothetical protein